VQLWTVGTDPAITLVQRVLFAVFEVIDVDPGISNGGGVERGGSRGMS